MQTPHTFCKERHVRFARAERGGVERRDAERGGAERGGVERGRRLFINAREKQAKTRTCVLSVRGL